MAGGWFVLAADQGQVIGTQHDLGTPAEGGVSSCETCHVPHEAYGAVIWEGDPRAGDEDFSGQAPACYSCHDGTVAGGAFAFDPDVGQHPIDREKGQDCQMCHDAHVSDFGSFLRFPNGANLCQACHEMATDLDHPVNINVHEAGLDPLDTEWGPEEGDLEGARLWDERGRLAGEYLKCLSCHAAHGGAPETLVATESESAWNPAFCGNCHRREGLR
jgi:predicted CXXCH cytochrome family protein